MAQPAFVFSCERAGSTVLRLVLDAHPQISCPDELNLGRLCADLYDAAEGTLGQAQDERQRNPAVLGEVRRLVSELMARLTTAERTSLWCEKCPANWRHAELLYRVFPDARYVILYRHPLDVSRSVLDATRGGSFVAGAEYLHRSPGNLLAASVESWLEKTSRLLDFEEDHPGQVLRVHYEAFVVEPQATLDAIFSFFGLEHPEGLLHRALSAERRQRVGHGDEKARYSTRLSRHSLGSGRALRWRNLLSWRQIDELNRVMARVGYPALDPDRDSYSIGIDLPTEQPLVSDLDELFAGYLPRQISRKPEVARDVPPLRFDVRGVGAWLLDTRDPDHPLAPATGLAAQADNAARIDVEPDALLDIVNGKLNVVVAQVLGKLRIDGPPTPLAHFTRLIAAAD